MRHSAILFTVIMMIAMHAAVGVARAQPCGPQWLPGLSFPGISGSVHASLAWDPDGDGPRSSVLVVAGNFQEVAGIVASNVAIWDPTTSTWSGLGSGVDQIAYALAVLPSGELIVGGAFDNAGGVGAVGIAKWDGETWSPLGSGFDNYVGGLLALSNGDLIASGAFRNAGAVSANRIARWNGSTWSALGSGLNNTGGEMVEHPDGSLIVSGSFTTAGGVPALRVARWDGSAWSPLGTGMNAPVYAMTMLPGGDLVVGGSFSSSGSAAMRIGRWNGTTWTRMDAGLMPSGQTEVRAFQLLPDGSLVAGGLISDAGGRSINLARWDGTTWSLYGGISDNVIRSLAYLPEAGLCIGGDFSLVDDVFSAAIACWDGQAWVRMSEQGFSGRVEALSVNPQGNLIAAGRFKSAEGGVRASCVAEWNGLRWSALGPGLGDGFVSVGEIAQLPGGDLLVGGNFWESKGAPGDYIARWNGRAWSPLSGDLSDSIITLAVSPTDEIVAGGWFQSCIRRWTGLHWVPVAAGNGLRHPTSDPRVSALAFLPNGDLFAGGLFATADGVTVNSIAQWDGLQWRPLGSGMEGRTFNSVSSIVIAPSGDLVAAGSFMTAGGEVVNNVARWNGQAWSPLGEGLSSSVNCLALLPNGNIVAGGSITSSGSTPMNGVARWDGTVWNPLGSGIAPAGVSKIVYHPRSGEIIAGGTFRRVAGVPTVFLARWTETGTPWVALDPVGQEVSVGETLMLEAAPATRYSNVSVQWRRNGVPIQNGPGGASSGGGLVTGATESLASPTDSTPARLTIENIRLSDVGDYTATFFNVCGEVSSLAAAITVTNRCPADFNEDDFLDLFDYVDFVTCFEGACQDPLAADFNADGFVDFFDYNDFVAAFELGC